MSTVTTVLVLLAVLAVTAALAKRVPIPLPLLLVASGVAMSFVPGFERLDIEPEVFFVLFIPPLLFADGWTIPKRELRGVLRPVMLLAFGLVLITVLSVGSMVHWLIPSIPIAAAFALGAIHVTYALVLWAALTVMRVIWVYPAAYLPHWLSRRSGIGRDRAIRGMCSSSAGPAREAR